MRIEDRPIVVFGIDMETDVGNFTPYYEGVKHGTVILLDLFARKSVEASFFFTGDCARRHRDVVKMVARSGHEVGNHSMYHETVGDAFFEIPNDFALLSEEVPRRLRLAHDTIADILGEQPVSFRSPRLWGSTQVVNALEKMGYAADVSYPMYYYHDRLAPYHPNREDWTKEGDLRIVEIPNFADMTMVSRDPVGADRDQWPVFRTKGAKPLMERVDRFVAMAQERGLPAVLCFYMHPWEFIHMKRKFHYGMAVVKPDHFLVQGCGRRGLRGLTELIDMLTERGAVFASAKNLAGNYQRWICNDKN